MFSKAWAAGGANVGTLPDAGAAGWSAFASEGADEVGRSTCATFGGPNIWNIAVAASGFSAVAAGTCAFCSAAVTGTPSAGAAISAERDGFTVADVPAARGPNMLNKPVGTTCGGPAGLEPSAAFWIVAGGSVTEVLGQKFVWDAI